MPKIFELIQASLVKYDKEVCFAVKKKGEWITCSSSEYRKKAAQVSHGLRALGLARSDRVVSLTHNRPEWNFLDLGLQQAGFVHVPVSPAISDQNLVFIVNDCGARILVVYNKFLYAKVKKLLHAMPSVCRVFTFDKVERADHFDSILELGDQDPDPAWLEETGLEIDPREYFTVIYTSGTTGNPKGVMLSHDNYVSVLPDLIIPMPDYRALSYMPLNHIFERTANYANQIRGVSVYYAENLANTLECLKEVRPHVLSTVPVLMEKLHSRILARAENLSWPGKLGFNWALSLSYKYDFPGQASLWFRLRHSIADRLVYRYWRREFGGNLKRVVCSAAAMREDLFHFFWAAGVPILHGYGLTETSGVISMDRFGDPVKLDKCGKIKPHIQVKIAGDSEILAKGASLMKGYFNNPELTAREIDADGWFHTGDLGAVDQDGYLKVLGRKKTYFKTLNGLFVNPEEIENALRISPFICHAFVMGANKISLSALLVPDFDYLYRWCKSKNIGSGDRGKMVADPAVTGEIRKVVDAYNSIHMDEGKRIGDFRILPDEWTVETGELTSTLKLKRNFIDEKYKDLILGLINK